MYKLIEIEFGEVVSIEDFYDHSLAEEAAKYLCGLEGIEYSGDLSYTNMNEYVVQIYCSDPYVDDLL